MTSELAGPAGAERQIKFLQTFATLYWFKIGGGVVAVYYVTQVLHASPEQLSVLFVIGAIAYIFSATPSSAIADKYGRNKVLVCTASLAFTGQVIAALSHSYVVYGVAWILASIANACIIGVDDAMIRDLVHLSGCAGRTDECQTVRFDRAVIIV